MRRTLSGLWVIAFATYAETVRRPLYNILLLAFAFLIFASQFITLFSFYQEANMIREMGVATMGLWAFIVLIVVTSMTVTAELENQTAVSILSKPISRTSFLLGKYFGLMMALGLGMLTLGLVLFFTLWWAFGWELLASPGLDHVFQGENARGVWSFIWNTFFVTNGVIVLEGILLSVFMVAVLASLCVSFAAFFPQVVTVAGTTFLFIVGNISAYVLGSVKQLDVGVLTFATRMGTYVLPNLGYFNLQSHFSEGRIISPAYLFAAALYTALYVGVVFLVTGSLFERREIR